jgi:hypothetical protein
MPTEPQPTTAPGRPDGTAAPRSLLAAVVLFLILAAGVYAAGFGPAMSPPPVVPATAPATEFSAERARMHLREISRAPSPVGSEEHGRVREYLLGAFQDLGLDPRVQETTTLRRGWGANRAAVVRNIVARLPGTDPTGAVVLMSHYDTAPFAPGATDAGNGVVAILETVRALRAGPPLANDVIVLITDAEEVGLLGAHAFVHEHPLAADAGVVLNAEGRGNAGPVLMFRTAGENGELIRTLARASPRPIATSLSDAVFQRMPNDTDLTVFDQAGLPGLDFANGHGITHYHTPLDSYEEADPRSLQHHGDYLLALARDFGRQDLAAIEAPPRSYFSVPWIGLVHYPLALALPLAVLAALVAAAAVALLAWRGHGRIPGIAAGVGVAVGTMGVLAIGAHLVWMILASLIPEPGWAWHGSPYNSGYYLVGFLALAASGFTGVYGLARRWLTDGELLAGGMVVWAALAVASAVLLTGGGYLFGWPLLFAAAGLAYAVTERPGAELRQAVVLGILSIPLLLVLVPKLEIIEVMLTIGMVAVPVALLGLAMTLLPLQLGVLQGGLGRLLPLGLALAGAVAIGGGLLTAGFDADHPKPNGVNYIADLSEGEAYWYSSDPAVDVWTAQFLGEDPARGPLPGWAAGAGVSRSDPPMVRQAPLLRADPPHADVLADSVTQAGRHLRLRVHSPPGTFRTEVWVAGEAAVRSAEVDGRPLPGGAGSGRDLVHFFGPPEGGFELALDLDPGRPLLLRLRAVLPGLPPTPGVRPRPPGMMTGPVERDFTRLQQTIDLGGDGGS